MEEWLNSQLEQKTSQLKLLLSKSRNEKLLKNILELSASQETDEVSPIYGRRFFFRRKLFWSKIFPVEN